MTLYPFQKVAIDRIRDRLMSGAGPVLYVAPTGSGKTATASRIIKSATERGRRSVFVAHRREIVEQCSERLDAASLPHGIVMSDHDRRRPEEPVQVCSIQTLAARGERALGWVPDLVIVDEAHHSISESWMGVLSRWPKAAVVGLTATPCRADGRAMGLLYKSMVLAPDTAELTSLRYLAPARVFAPPPPDLSQLTRPRKGSDWDREGLEAVMINPVLVGDVVSTWERLGGHYHRTIAYAAGVRHSMALVAAFLAAGVTAAHIDDETPKGVRRRTIEDVSCGRIKVLSNYGIVTEGVDIPAVDHIILDRPTESFSLYRQMVGRGARSHPGKYSFIVQDHANCTRRHGLFTSPVEWSLDGSFKRKGENDDLSVRVCQLCYAAYDAAVGACPHCGYVNPPVAKEQERAAGELVELTDAVPAKKPRYTIRNLSSNPDIARLQQAAEREQHSPGWFYWQLQMLEGRRK